MSEGKGGGWNLGVETEKVSYDEISAPTFSF